jgi:hypothetical protein
MFDPHQPFLEPRSQAHEGDVGMRWACNFSSHNKIWTSDQQYPPYSPLGSPFTTKGVSSLDWPPENCCYHANHRGLSVFDGDTFIAQELLYVQRPSGYYVC